MAKKKKKTVRLSEIRDDRFTFRYGDQIIEIPIRMTEPVDWNYVNRNVEETQKERRNPKKAKEIDWNP